GENSLAEEPERDVVVPVADGAREREDEEQQRERHHDLGDAGDDRVDPAAVVARDRAHDDPDDHAQDGGADRDLERDLRAVEEAQELVPPELPVAAQDEEDRAEMARRAGVRLVHEVRPRADREERVRVDAAGELVVRPVSEQAGGDRSADERPQEEEHDEDAAAERDLVALEPQPHLLPVASRAYRLELTERGARFDRDGGGKTGARGEDLRGVLFGGHPKVRQLDAAASTETLNHV